VPTVACQNLPQPFSARTSFAAVPTTSSWDETSGYGSVETSRATASRLLAPAAAPSWDETRGYGGGLNELAIDTAQHARAARTVIMPISVCPTSSRSSHATRRMR
jgi:hypothetical protein